MRQELITSEVIKKLEEINEALKGTFDHGRYQMSCEVKTNGKWTCVGWGVPRSRSGFNGAYIKVVKGVKYIYCQEGYDEYGFRYCVTENVAGLFGWEV